MRSWHRSAADQRGIVDLADTNLKIDSLFDEIAQLSCRMRSIDNSSCFFNRELSLLLK